MTTTVGDASTHWRQRQAAQQGREARLARWRHSSSRRRRRRRSRGGGGGDRGRGTSSSPLLLRLPCSPHLDRGGVVRRRRRQRRELEQRGQEAAAHAAVGGGRREVKVGREKEEKSEQQCCSSSAVVLDEASITLSLCSSIFRRERKKDERVFSQQSCSQTLLSFCYSACASRSCPWYTQRRTLRRG